MAEYRKELNLTQIITGVFTAVAIGVVMGAVATIRTADTTALVAARNQQDIAELEDVCVPRGELEVELRNIDRRLDRIEKLLIQM